MNRGEGLRIAARAKNGTVGLFQEDKKTKKKFSYKSRTQAFPVRKVETTVDDRDVKKQIVSKPSQQGRDASSKRLGNKPKDVTKEKSASASRDAETSKERGRNLRKKEFSGSKKRPQVDFIKKNKEIGGTSSGVGGANTIALTQEQLNAILQSIGAAHGASGSPTISVENGQVKVQSDTNTTGDKEEKGEDEETGRQEGEAEEKKEEEETKKTKDDDDRKTVASENVLSLLEQLNRETDGEANKAQTEISSKPPSLPKTPDTNVGKTEDDTYKRRSASTDLKEKGGNNKWGNSVGMGNIGAVVGGQRDGGLTLQEKKKQEWKKALDEQLAEKRRLQEMEIKLHRSLDGNNVESYQRKASPQQVPSTITTESNLPKERPRKDPADDIILKSSLGEVAQQSYIPAAMRSSFFIGGSAGQRADNHNTELKRKEQQEWMQELEKQRREAAERKERERRKHREEGLAMEHWADPVEHKSSSRGPEIPNLSQVKDDSHLVSSSKKEDPPSFNSSQTADILSPRQNGEVPLSKRGVNALIDPAELERREAARKKHLEHMRAVQQQVEEKQRIKREAEERRRREEAEEERRLAKEREDLQRQFDLENEKQKKKEREAAAKQKALEDSIFNAQREALAAKHAKRVERLTQHGHDATNLRKSWEFKQSTDYSPRQVVHSSQQHSPPAVENLDTQTVPQEPQTERFNSEGVPGTRDVGTVTVSEQSTQTGLEFFNHEALSPRLLEAIRQASAGIEYKVSRDRTSQKGGKYLDEDKYSEKEERITKRRTEKTEKIEEVEKPRQKKKAEKPKWGQNVTKKKVSNSEKDLSRISKGREERRRKRQEELLAQQERLTRRRDSLKKTSRQEINEEVASEASADGKIPRGVSNLSREHSKVDNRRGGNDEGKLGATEVVSQGSPELTGRDFYPFLRSEDVKLNNRSVNVTPVREETVKKERTYIDTNTYQPVVELDPLLNPERLKDSGQRQEKILEQLSHLRQGLMMKQREIELGLSPMMMM